MDMLSGSPNIQLLVATRMNLIHESFNGNSATFNSQYYTYDLKYMSSKFDYNFTKSFSSYERPNYLSFIIVPVYTYTY